MTVFRVRNSTPFGPNDRFFTDRDEAERYVRTFGPNTFPRLAEVVDIAHFPEEDSPVLVTEFREGEVVSYRYLAELMDYIAESRGLDFFEAEAQIQRIAERADARSERLPV